MNAVSFRFVIPDSDRSTSDHSSPTTRAFLIVLLTALPGGYWSRNCRSPVRGRFRFLDSPQERRARQCIGRIEFNMFVYGLEFASGCLSTSHLNDAVTQILPSVGRTYGAHGVGTKVGFAPLDRTGSSLLRLLQCGLTSRDRMPRVVLF